MYVMYQSEGAVRNARPYPKFESQWGIPRHTCSKRCEDDFRTSSFENEDGTYSKWAATMLWRAGETG